MLEAEKEPSKSSEGEELAPLTILSKISAGEKIAGSEEQLD